MRTEDRPLPPTLKVGDTLLLGPLRATVEGLLDHPRLVSLLFSGTPDEIWAGLARHGTSDSVFARARLRSNFGTYGPKSPGRLLPSNHLRPASCSTGRFCRRFANTRPPSRRSLTPQAFHRPATKISIDCCRSTSHIAFPRRRRKQCSRTRSVAVASLQLGQRSFARSKMRRRKMVNYGCGEGIAKGRIGPTTHLRVVDAILSGTHEPGTSHYELLRAFLEDSTLERATEELDDRGYRTHEFGDSVLILQS